MIRAVSLVLASLTVAGHSTSVLAHHGASPYDTAQSVTLTGTVTQFRFTNPHVLIYANVRNDAGEMVEWSGELTSPNRLARAAGPNASDRDAVRWSKDILKPGDTVQLTGNPARNGAPQLRLRKVVDANGIALVGGEISTPPLEVMASAAPSALPQRVEIENHGADFSGVWMRDDASPHLNYAFSIETPSMTPWALAKYEASKPTFGERGVTVAETNDPVYQCLPPGVPRIYFHPRPFEIIQLPNRVLMSFEYQALLRPIYTDGRGHRDDLAATWMGDAIGHWEGETLVIESTNFNDKTWVDRRGIPHSEELRVVERIHREGERLIVDITIDDTIAFTEPWTGRKTFSATDWTIEEFVCLDNSSFSDFEELLRDHD